MLKKWVADLAVNPAKIGTAQQKRFDPRTRRFFVNRRVAAGMKTVSLLAKSARIANAEGLPPKTASVALVLVFWYAVPQSRRKAKNGYGAALNGTPCTAAWAGDCDNRAKAVIDALTMAGFWEDDRYVTKLKIEKRWTIYEPKIRVEICEDLKPSGDGGEADVKTNV